MKNIACNMLAIATMATCAPSAQAQVTSLPISSMEIVRGESGLPVVRAIMTNNSQRTTGQVFVTFALYDPTGTQLGVTLAQTSGLEPGQSWRIQAQSPYSDVRSAKLIDIKVF